jgi:hypothetical protein
MKNMLLVFFAAVLFSCGREDAIPGRLFVKEIIDPTLYKDVFTYEDGRLIEFNRFLGDRVETNSQFHYLNNQLLKVEIKRGQTIAYTVELTYDKNGFRQDEKLTTLYDGQITNIQTSIFTHQDGILKSILNTNSDPNYAPMEAVYEWSNGNIIKIDYYYIDIAGPHFSASRTITYDTKKNYSNQDIAFIYRTLYESETTLSKNNALTNILTLDEQVIDQGSHTFLYNSSGYPKEYTYKIYGQEFNPIEINYY